MVFRAGGKKILIFYYSPINAVDGNGVGIIAPSAVSYCTKPIVRSAAKIDARKVGTFREGISANNLHAVRDYDALKAGAIKEGIINGRYTSIFGDDAVFASCY